MYLYQQHVFIPTTYCYEQHHYSAIMWPSSNNHDDARWTETLQLLSLQWRHYEHIQNPILHNNIHTRTHTHTHTHPLTKMKYIHIYTIQLPSYRLKYSRFSAWYSYHQNYYTIKQERKPNTILSSGSKSPYKRKKTSLMIINKLSVNDVNKFTSWI